MASRRLFLNALSRQQRTSTASLRPITTSTTINHEHSQYQQQQQQQRAKSEALSRTRSKIPTAKAKAALASRAQLSPLTTPPPSLPPQPQPKHHRTDTTEDHPLPEVIAYSTAQAYDFSILARSNRLPQGWSFLEEGDVIHIPHWPISSSSSSDHLHSTSSAALPSYNSAPLPGETFIFRSGAYVTWGLTEDQAKRFHRAVIRGRPANDSSSSSSSARSTSSSSLPFSFASSSSPNSKNRNKSNNVSSARDGNSETTGGVEVGAYNQIGDEAMEYLIRDDQPTRVVGDLIVLGHKPRLHGDEPSSEPDSAPGPSNNNSNNNSPHGTAADGSDSSTYAPWSPLLARLSFSLGLARSARLTTQESSLDMFMLNPSSSSTNTLGAQPTHPGSARIPLSDIPRELERTGRVPLGRKEVIKRMGKLLRLRLEANLDVEESFLDDNAFWENERLQHHYESICRALDIDRRFKAFNEKLDHVESLLSTLRALLTESSTHRMELIIIILIAIEVLNAFFGHSHSHEHHHHPVYEGGEALEDRVERAEEDGRVSSRGWGYLPSVSGLWRWATSSSPSVSPSSA
ncbi:hypothetical protein A4X13_0g257 [Tilletia indica]|uniref:DUF155 domain-containing protein n=1 Tax=Tilletia indica TaxID=43049 RepID=A0A177TJZ4_9BASI|nr:hypothetical protein A4X13_0g257 [Tilletia indica]